MSKQKQAFINKCLDFLNNKNDILITKEIHIDTLIIKEGTWEYKGKQGTASIIQNNIFLELGRYSGDFAKNAEGVWFYRGKYC